MRCRFPYIQLFCFKSAYVKRHFGGPKYIYDPLTQSIGLVKDKRVLESLARRVRNDVANICSASLENT